MADRGEPQPHLGEDAYLALLGLSIRSRRRHLGLSQADLADATGLHRTYLSEVETGGRNVTLLTLRRIAVALDTDIAFLSRDAGL
jgi:transcriptional regulator with XRE-family HTH domain